MERRGLAKWPWLKQNAVVWPNGHGRGRMPWSGQMTLVKAECRGRGTMFRVVLHEEAVRAGLQARHDPPHPLFLPLPPPTNPFKLLNFPSSSFFLAFLLSSSPSLSALSFLLEFFLLYIHLIPLLAPSFSLFLCSSTYLLHSFSLFFTISPSN